MDEPSRGGLTISGRPRSPGTAATRAASCSSGRGARSRGVGRPSATHSALGGDLVHRRCSRAITPRAGVRDAQQLERALHRAVFAVAAVQRDEARGRSPASVSSPSSCWPGSKAWASTPLRLQRGQHAAAGHQRDVAFGGIDRPSARRPCRGPSHRTDGSSCALLQAIRVSPAPGRAPIVPAPIEITTSPSRCVFTMADGMSRDVARRRSGPPCRATRNARARERPSAATIGASPAAYTSPSSTHVG